MIITNNFNLPDPIVRALSHDDYTRGESNRSVTQLIDAPRVRILKKEHAEKITYDASELIWIALGKAIHRMFEEHGVGKWKPEERLFAECRGWTISGQVDIQYHCDEAGTTQSVSLYDYKVTSVYSYIFWKASYDQQLNFYAWLAEQHGMPVDGLYIVFVFRDWRKADALKNKDYPVSPIMVVPANLWPKTEQDVYVDERVKIHQDAEFLRLTGEELPFCTDEERWKNPSQYAVKKPKNKRATKVFDSQDEAEQFISENDGKGFVVEDRPAVPKRCADGWCPVADWCSQWLAEQEQEVEV